MKGSPKASVTPNPIEPPVEHVDQGVASASSARQAVRFYESDASLARMVAEFLHQGFEAGNPGIVMATPDLRAAILHELTVRSLDAVDLQRSGDLLLLDARESLSTFMTHGQPDGRKFTDQMCQAIQRVCERRTRCTVRIFGQMVDVLWKDGQRDAAVKLEMLWNQLAKTEAFSLVCGYAMGNFYKDARSGKIFD
jgi:hypothetical protein